MTRIFKVKTRYFGKRLVCLNRGMLVLIIELLNSAVETVVDRIGAELHILSRQAKDLGSDPKTIS
ncbi:MAG: diacylglycerol kinase [Desulfobacterales bacterium]